MDVTLRRGTPADVDACAAICHAAFATLAGHHNFPPDFPSPEPAAELLAMLLSRDDVYGVVAEIDGRVVASNFLWEMGPIAGVGPITVDPGVQDRAVGRRLMEDVLERGRQRRLSGVRLVQATYHTRSLSLYTKLGFDTRELLVNLQGPPLNVAIPGRTVRPVTEGDVAACDALYQRVHGHTRTRELLDAAAMGVASLVEHDGRISGYTTGVGFFGHAVGSTTDDLKALIGAAPVFAGPGFLLPARHAELFRWCLAHGLRVVQPLTLMSMGLYNEPAGAFLPSILY